MIKKIQLKILHYRYTYRTTQPKKYIFFFKQIKYRVSRLGSLEFKYWVSRSASYDTTTEYRLLMSNTTNLFTTFNMCHTKEWGACVLYRTKSPPNSAKISHSHAHVGLLGWHVSSPSYILGATLHQLD